MTPAPGEKEKRSFPSAHTATDQHLASLLRSNERLNRILERVSPQNTPTVVTEGIRR